MKFFILVCFLVLFGAGCHKDTWQGFYYPYGTSGATSKSRIFETLDQCREWIKSSRRALTHDESEDWECGKNCRIQDSSIDLSICDETAR